MNNRHGAPQTLTDGNVEGGVPSGMLSRPVSVEPGRRLRDEAVHELTDGPQARQVRDVLASWRDWFRGYENAHIEFEGPNGEIGRTELENSYMPEYGKRYYAKLKGLERGIEREFQSLTTVMLTFTASHENANGGWRCPADHMRDIADGWKSARKMVHKALSGRDWEYARVWEPHKNGYGHLHVAIFVEGDVSEREFRPVMESYTENVESAGSEAHAVGEAVSVNDNVENMGSYISEYVGIFGDETLNRPKSEQVFYAVSWASNTRRVDFSNGAQELIARDQFRQETGLTPDSRGGGSFDEWRGADEGSDWSATAICTVNDGEPNYSVPEPGGEYTKAIRGRPGFDPEKPVS